jgi:hypothetical protein
MKLRAILPFVLASAAFVTPASANWFSNPSLGINRCVCTAPSPTPEQVRAARMPPYVLQEQQEPVTVGQAMTPPPAPPPVAGRERRERERQASAQYDQKPPQR